MERFLLRKEKVEEVWRSLKEGPHVPLRQMVIDVVAILMGQEEQCPTSLTTSDIENIYANHIAFSKTLFGVPPSFFEHIKL